MKKEKIIDCQTDRQRRELFTIMDIARAAGVTHRAIKQAIEYERIPPPTELFGKRYFYRRDQVAKLVKVWSTKNAE